MSSEAGESFARRARGAPERFTEDEFDELFLAEHNRIRGFLLAMGTPEEVVDAAVCHTFMVLKRNWAAIEDPRPYAYKVARNYRAKAIRTMRPQPIPTDVDIDRIWDGGIGQLVDRVVLEALLAKLPVRQREAVLLLNLVQMSSDEAGKVLGIAASTVRNNAADGRQALKKLLKG